MSKVQFSKIICADFETTVYENQTDTRVWSAAFVELYSDNVIVEKSIEGFFNHLFSYNKNTLIYFHNLKFDGSFILYYLLNDLHYKQAYFGENYDIEWKLDKDLENNEVKYLISNMGQWYKIIVKHNNHIYEFRDSYKLLPFSIENIGLSFNTEHKKLSMEYEGYREPNGIITDEELEYIKNDVLVMKEALEIMYDEGHKNLTIGSCCMREFRSVCNKMKVVSDGLNKDQIVQFNPIDKPQYMHKNSFFEHPDLPYLYDIEIDEKYGAKTAGEYIKKSYRGGWCYLAEGKENKIYENGTTADVNSLYPSMMHSESGNYYPYGEPIFIDHFDENIKNFLEEHKFYYFVRFRTRFHIKPNKLPFLSIKNNPLYPANKCLSSSNIYNKRNKEWYEEYIDVNGNKQKAVVELTLTWNEYNLFLEHYILYDTEYLDCCYFNSSIGMFDQYIDKYRKIKMESKGAKRTLAKLFLNNLYGKMATSTSSSFKIAHIEDKRLKFRMIIKNDKRAGYIAVGSAITAYAREFTIRAAQANYHGKYKSGFIYADTDSIHCNLQPNQITGIKIDDKAFCCWKLESSWDKAIFVRAKTYIEHINKEDLVECNPYYDIKCAGMPQSCKDLFIDSMTGTKRKDFEYEEQELEFVNKKRELTDFKIGLKVPSKLMPHQIEGGVLLMKTDFTMKEGLF